jgi:hypothetical protein
VRFGEGSPLMLRDERRIAGHPVPSRVAADCLWVLDVGLPV